MIRCNPRKKDYPSTVILADDMDTDDGEIEEGEVLEEKIPRNAFLKLDLDAIALRMRKDLADRCCCADVPCVSTIKEYLSAAQDSGLCCRW